VLYVHSCPPALCPHVEWAAAGVLGVPVSLTWTAQPAAPGSLRAEIAWRAPAGTAARIASSLREWGLLRFEVTEDPSGGCDGERFAVTPSLGLFRATVGATGDIQVGEDRLRALLGTAPDGVALAHGLERLLGTEWDEELEPYREAGEGAPVRWLHAASG
jgi:hypothetical protein